MDKFLLISLTLLSVFLFNEEPKDEEENPCPWRLYGGPEVK